MAHIKSRKHAPSQSARLSPCATAALTLLALPAAVLAQTSGTAAQQTTLPEVKAKAQEEVPFKADAVSNPKFTQPLIDTPQTISVIKKELLKQQNATSLTEALRNTPGVTIQLGENGNTQTGDSIFMRGFDTSNSIFVDGVRDLGGISRDTFNLEQIEVVKGPSGSETGRVSPSGFVNLVSKAPQTERFVTGGVTLGTADRKRATLDWNQPLDLAIQGSALRLNLMTQDYGVPGRDVVTNKRWGIAPSIAFGIGSPTTTTLSYLHVEQNNIPDGGVSTFGMPGYGYAPANPSATPPTRAQLPGAPVDSSNYYGLYSDYDDVTLDMFTARIEHTLAPGYTLRNTSRLGRTVQDFVLTGVNAVGNQYANAYPDTTPNSPDLWTVSRSRQGRHQTNEILTNQTNLTAEVGSGFVKHSISTGIEFIYEHQHIDTLGTVSGTANLYNPNPSDAMAVPQYNGVYTDGTTLTAAVYLFDTIKLGESWLLNGGLRLDKYNTRTDSASIPTTGPQSGTLVQAAQVSKTDTLPSYKFGAVFKPATNGSIYAAYSQSQQPPGGNNFQLVAGNPNTNNAGRTDLDPQIGTNLELGTKWDFLDGRLATTAAIYRSENKNELLSDGAAVPTYTQIGKRRVDGVELGAVGQITPAFNLSAGLALMDSKILAGPQSGNAIVFTPEVTFTSWATYKLPIGLTFGGGVRYVDTQARTSNTITGTSTNLNTIDDYWVADAMVSYEVNKNLTLQLNLNNLFDEDYVSSINSGGSRYRPGEARNALLTANVTF
jgi:catecholate siderophore receptor